MSFSFSFFRLSFDIQEFKVFTSYSKEQSSTKALLDSIQRNAKEMANANGRELERAQNRVGESLSRLESLQQSADELAQQLKNLQAVTEATQRGNYILRRLHFAEICQRESDVSVAEQDTFGWIVGDPVEPPRSASDIAQWDAFNSLRCFLRQSDGGSIFFFCGKAGSGKSTMMKFLSKHSAVRSGLEEWAADGKKLIMVTMFFWSSENRLQRTTEGFYRTILFHTLSQCPELVANVFPTENSPTKPADDLTIIAPFPVGELEEAFDRLVKFSGGDMQNDFRFCYLIDGLDEYDGDSQSYRALAKKLVRWSSQLDRVKIICSARPYTVFRDTFRDAGTTLEFHELTRQDMFKFASRQFAINLTHPVPTICRDACLASVDRIVARADGVFLWASLVVRSLINGALDGVLDGDAVVEKVKERLKECPDKVEDMFAKMISKVDPSPSARRQSNMIMYLAAYNPISSALNALTLAWLDDASWFENGNLGSFPFNQQPRPYTESEVAAKHAYARKLLYSLTQGLLELKDTTTTTSSCDQIPYLRYSIGFCHRSVVDFLRGHCREPFGCQSTLTEVYGRLRAAEVKFLSSAPAEESQQLKLAPTITYLYEYTFFWLSDLARRACHSSSSSSSSSSFLPSSSCLGEFEQAITSKVPRISWGNRQSTVISSSSALALEAFWLHVFRGTMHIGSERSHRWEAGDSGRAKNLSGGCSFLHFATYWFQGRYFRDRLVSGCDDDVSEELSILLSSSVASDVETTRFLLDQGRRRPSDCIRGFSDGDHQQRHHYSVWAVFLRDFANVVNQYEQKERARREWPVFIDSSWLNRLSAIIELYLAFGADPDAYFHVDLLGSTSAEEEATTTAASTAITEPRVFVVTLAQMLEVFKPENLSSVQKYLGVGGTKTMTQGLQLLSSPQLLKEQHWQVWAVILPGWKQSLWGGVQVRVF